MNCIIPEQVEFKFKVPLLQVLDSTFVVLEPAISRGIPIDLDPEMRSSMEPFLMDLEGLLAFVGFNGRECVLRNICELAAEPFVQPHGLVGELLGIFSRNMFDISNKDDVGNDLTSRNKIETLESETSSEDEDVNKSRRNTTMDYIKAGLMGRSGEDCQQAFPDCPVSIFSMLNQDLIHIGE
ncbi:uncharacterized protein LOC143037745 [Oratosquilla oratoria]|uniref:uncharacterized protein LOC143037745 n=1 Tax=Oratosquilla oratoria TaxID=337810 RepID=UPI003F7731AC